VFTLWGIWATVHKDKNDLASGNGKCRNLVKIELSFSGGFALQSCRLWGC
jgi:hypothetical protein